MTLSMPTGVILPGIHCFDVAAVLGLAAINAAGQGIDRARRAHYHTCGLFQSRMLVGGREVSIRDHPENSALGAGEGK